MVAPGHDAPAPARAAFWSDLARAIGTWSRAPLLPIVAGTLIVGLTASDTLLHHDVAPFASLVLALVYAGWEGIVRIWYLRAFRDQHLDPREVPGLWAAFVARMFLLMLVITVFALPVGFILAATEVEGFLLVAIVALAAAAQIWVTTFAAPALAYSTRGVAQSIIIAGRFIRDHGAETLPYVAIPALTAVALSLWGPQDAPARGIAAFASGVALAAAAGAAAAFYLREHETGDDGAAQAPSNRSRRSAEPSS